MEQFLQKKKYVSKNEDASGSPKNTVSQQSPQSEMDTLDQIDTEENLEMAIVKIHGDFSVPSESVFELLKM